MSKDVKRGMLSVELVNGSYRLMDESGVIYPTNSITITKKTKEFTICTVEFEMMRRDENGNMVNIFN